jgi:hypothetical protein
MSDPPDNSPSAINHDLLCMRCGYNLRFLMPSDACTECGRPVCDSIAFEASQPSLAAGSGRLAAGAAFMLALALINGVIHLGSNLTYDLLGRQIWTWVFNPLVAAGRVINVCLLLAAVISLARSGLSPPLLRRPSPLPGMLVMGLIGAAVTTLVLAGINLLEFPLGIRPRLPEVRLRYACYLLQSFSHFPIYICGFVYLRNLAARPEFAGFRGIIQFLFGANLFFWATFVLVESFLLAVVFFVVQRPGEPFWNVLRALDWVGLAINVPEIFFWALLARRARALRPETAAG